MQLMIHVGHKIGIQMRRAAASLEDLTLSSHLSLLHNIYMLKPSGILFSCLTSLAADESQAPSRPVRLEPQTPLVQCIMGRFLLRFLCTGEMPRSRQKLGNLESLQTNEWNEAPLHFTDTELREVHKQELDFHRFGI